jgi:hypothetical protein
MTCWKKRMSVDDTAGPPRLLPSLARQLMGHCDHPVSVVAPPRMPVRYREIP